MDIQTLSRQTLATCREQGWAALETGISRPIPILIGGSTQLWFLLYRSQVRPPYQMYYEPFARVAVDYNTGKLLERQTLETSDPPNALGRYPHAAAASIPHDRWQAVWDELFDLYPDIIAAYAGQSAAGQKAKVERFSELWQLTMPPFMEKYYHAMNPGFFKWLQKTR